MYYVNTLKLPGAQSMRYKVTVFLHHPLLNWSVAQKPLKILFSQKRGGSRGVAL
jgi:hypothetical protein